MGYPGSPVVKFERKGSYEVEMIRDEAHDA